jgi:caa(3)-type oxidase subunit IV
MADSHAQDIDKHVRTYIIVFVSLMVLTVITVAVAFLKMPVWMGIAVALFIATIKGTLVACYFMHLISENGDGADGVLLPRSAGVAGIDRHGRDHAVMKKVTRVTVLLAAVLMLAPTAADACTVCFGEAEGPMIDGARMGVYLLFGLTVAVQVAFGAFFVNLYRRSRGTARREAVKETMRIVKSDRVER